MIAEILIAVFGPQSHDVKFPGVGGLELNGSLVLPAGTESPVPAVLLLPGSGPTDRDGNQPPAIVTDLLKQIAEALAKEGIASLRFDKRAHRGYSTKWPADVPAQNDFFAWDKFVGDAMAGLTYLRSRKEIDPKWIGIAGHSEGSSIAMQIGSDTAGKDSAPGALILMGAPGRPIGELLKEQVAASLKRSGLTESMAKPYNDYVTNAIKEIVDKGKLPADPAPTGLGALFPPSAIKLLRSYFTTDPPTLVKAFSGPVLVVQGEKDIQVLAKKDTPLLEAALKSRSSGTTEVYIAPSASHNLKVVNDENKEPGMAGPVEPGAIKKIVDWAKANLKKP